MIKPFMTVAGRWRRHVEASSLDTRLPPAEFALATMFFFAGFSACLDAVTEAAEYPEDEAETLLALMKDEIDTITATVSRAVAGIEPS